MKKLSFVLFTTAIIMMAACSSQEFNDESPSSPPSSNISNKIRSYEDALKIAQGSLSMLDDQRTSTRGESKTRKIDITNSKKVVKLDAKTRSNLGVNDTLIYVFNFENDEGFVLVSASENTEAILAITEQGNYNPEVRSEIEGFEMFIDLAKRYITYTSEKSIEEERMRGLQIDTFVHDYTITAGPYVTVKWGQDYPEGELCSNSKAGCANTAMAQIMSYYQYPSGITLTYSGADVTYQNLNWSNLNTHNSNNPIHHQYSSSCNDANSHLAISRFLRQIGEVTNSMYNTNYTSTDPMNVSSAFSSLGYNVSTYYTYNGQSIRNQLDNAHLIFIWGNNNNSAHGWVLDGYLTDNVTEYIMEPVDVGGHILWVIIDQFGTNTNYYNHFNWGWYGKNNGYFLDNVFNTASVIFPESNTIYNKEFWNIFYYIVYY